MDNIVISALKFLFSSFLILLAASSFTYLNAQEHKNIFGKSYERESKSIIEGFRDSLKTSLNKIDTTVVVDDSALIVYLYANKDDEISYQIVEGGVETYNYKYSLVNKLGIFKLRLAKYQYAFEVNKGVISQLYLINKSNEKMLEVSFPDNDLKNMEIKETEAWYKEYDKPKFDLFKEDIMYCIENYFIIL